MVTKNVGDSVTLNVTPGGGPSGTIYTAKIYKSGTSIPIFVLGAGIYTYTKANLQVIDTGNYYTTTEYTCPDDGTLKGPISSNIVGLVVNPVITGNTFSVYNISNGTTVIGVTVILDNNGAFTKDQACVEVCNRLGLM